MVQSALQFTQRQETNKDEKKNENIIIEVHKDKVDFILSMQESDFGFCRFHAYSIADLSQDFRQYEAVLRCEKLAINKTIFKPS